MTARPELVRLRKARGATQAEVGAEVGVDEQTVSRYERGLSSPEGERFRKYAQALRVTTKRLQSILDGTDDGQDDDAYRDQLLPKRFNIYVSLEQAARWLGTYEHHVVEGLLQTEDYARALIQAERGMGAHLEKLVALRLSRQKALTRAEKPLTYQVVMYEAALRLQVGGPKTMRAQLVRVLELAELPNVSVRVLPFSAGPNNAGWGGFGLLTQPWEDGPSVVYLETYDGPVYKEDVNDIASFVKRYEHLVSLSQSEEQSIHFVEQLAKRYR